MLDAFFMRCNINRIAVSCLTTLLLTSDVSDDPPETITRLPYVLFRLVKVLDPFVMK